VAFTLVAAIAFSRIAAGQDPVRTELAARHVALARKLEKGGFFREARRELLLALELDPDDAGARSRLGYKREGEAWTGTPAPPRPSRAELAGALLEECAALHREAAKSLAAEAAATEDEPARRSLAGLALEEDPNEKKAREVLRHVKKGFLWVSPREALVLEVFASSAGESRVEPPKNVSGDAELVTLLGLGELHRLEDEHAVFLSTEASGADLLELARAIDTTRRAWAHFLPKDAPPAGDVSRPKTRARWLVVAPAEHDLFLDRASVEKGRRAVAKQLRSWSGWITVPATGEKAFVYESSLGALNRTEWAALTAVKTLLQQSLARTATAPGFLVEGFARFFSGRATGKVEISFVSTKETRSVQERAARGFDEFRAGVREVLARSLEGDLGRLVTKGLNELEEGDSEEAFAFVEYALARKPEALRAFLRAISPEEPVLATFERAFGSSASALEREMRAWAREEY
jgi:tetratricopeptide (TPR) repeat protein